MRIENLVFSYGDKTIFNSFSLETDARMICLMGPSGCGKTTLLNLIAGLQKPQDGTIEGVGQPCALMFQEDRLLEWTDALTNVALVLDAKKDSLALDKAAQILELLGIDPKMPIRKMSGGMRRRVALSRALIFDAPTLLLDEPFKGLDEPLMKRCASIVRDAGKLTIVSTHSPEEAQILDAQIVRLS